MAIHLKLRREPAAPAAEDTSASEPRTLRFPFEAVRKMPAKGQRLAAAARRVAERPLRETLGPVLRSADVVQQIEATLDRMQERLDDVKGQLQSAYRLTIGRPSTDDRPSAA